MDEGKGLVASEKQVTLITPPSLLDLPYYVPVVYFFLRTSVRIKEVLAQKCRLFVSACT